MARGSSEDCRDALDLRPDRADAFGMLEDANRADLLAFCCEQQLVRSLRRELERHGVRIDFAGSLVEMRAAFFARGGHDLLIVTPDVPVSLAERAIRTLLDLDPEVAVVAFGRELQGSDLPDSVTRLPEHHPTSRAGIGAILRVASGIG